MILSSMIHSIITLSTTTYWRSANQHSELKQSAHWHSIITYSMFCRLILDLRGLPGQSATKQYAELPLMSGNQRYFQTQYCYHSISFCPTPFIYSQIAISLMAGANHRKGVATYNPTIINLQPKPWFQWTKNVFLNTTEVQAITIY